MTYNICLLIGLNSNDLFGPLNDLNIAKKTFKKKELDIHELLVFSEEKAKLDNIINSINKYININNLIIFFSGHGNKYGFLKLYDQLVSNENICKNIKTKIKNLVYILDTCFSENFIIKNNFKNINCITLLSSCNKDQKSKEAMININKEYIIVGIFTYYLFKIMNYKRIYNINDWQLLCNNNLWSIIDKKFSQTISYKKFFLR